MRRQLLGTLLQLLLEWPQRVEAGEASIRVLDLEHLAINRFGVPPDEVIGELHQRKRPLAPSQHRHLVLETTGHDDRVVRRQEELYSRKALAQDRDDLLLPNRV